MLENDWFTAAVSFLFAAVNHFLGQAVTVLISRP